MRLYAELPRYRTRQIVGDLATLAWIVLWVRVGMWIDTLVNRLSVPGDALEDAGNGLAGNLASIGEDIGGVPVVGGTLEGPFRAASEAGRSLARAGVQQQEAVHTLAVWLGLAIALIPILYVLIKVVPRRLGWVRDAKAASGLRIDADDLHLFALRAIANQPLAELRRVAPDPSAALARGDYEGLASLELGALGLSTRTTSP
jgi:hypothetical protein